GSGSSSPSGEPIINLPGGIRVSFMPMEFVMPLSPSCAHTASGVGKETTSATTNTKRHADMRIAPTQTSLQSEGKLSTCPIQPSPTYRHIRPVADHEQRRKPGDDRAKPSASLLDV